MRLALALLTLACAGSAAAEPVQDRYGPPRKASPSASTPTPAYDGRLLGWPGKAAPQPRPAAPEQSASVQPPPPQAAAAPPAPAKVAVRPEPRRLADVPAAAPAAPAAPAPRAAPIQSAAAPLPQTLYDAPIAPPASPPRMAQVAAAPPPPLQPQPRGAAHSRLYSLHREYGMAPDTVPAAPSGSNYVLIGPSDAPAEADETDAPARKPIVDARLY